MVFKDFKKYLLSTETNKFVSISPSCPWPDSYGKSIILLQQKLFLQAFTILCLLNLQLTFNTVYLFLQSPARESDYSLVFGYLFTWSCTKKSRRIRNGLGKTSFFILMIKTLNKSYFLRRKITNYP